MIGKNLKTLLLPLILGVAATAGGQTLTDYDFSIDATEFQTIAGTAGAHTDVWGYGQQDDGTRTFGMPFAFPFGESTVDSGSNVILSANGYMQFGLIAMGSYANTAYTSTASQYKAIVPYINTDGYCNGNIYWADTTDSQTGTEVLIAEFRGITTYSARTSPESVNYQIRLYPDGTIKVIFDSSDFNAIANHTLFLTNGYADRVCLTGSWAEAVPGTPAQLPSLDSVPEAGTCYTFVPPAGVCPRPTALTLDSTATNALGLSWTGTAEGYTLFYSDNDTAWTDSIEAIGETTYVLGDLLPQTAYRIAVRSDCSDTNHSTLSLELTATTACGIVGTAQMPYAEDFETYSSYQFNPCWARLYRENDMTLNTAYPTVVYQSTGNSTHNIKLNAQNTSGGRWTMFALPEFEANIADLQLSFTYMLNDTADVWLVVGTLNAEADTASFEPMDTVLHTAAAYSWDTAEVAFAAYQGQGSRIAVRFSTTAASQYINKNLWMDDLMVMYTPSCTRPQSVSVDTVGTDFAELSIADSDDDATYEVSYWAEGGDTLTETFYGRQGTLGGLQNATVYNVEVRKLCPDGTQTLSVSTQLTTACESLTHADLPYSEDFNSYEAWNGAPINPCWGIINLNPDGPYPYPSMYANHSGQNGNALFMYAGSDGNGQYMSLPAMDDLTDLSIGFYTKAQTTACRLDVGVMVDPADTATFTTLYTVVPEGTDWEEHNVSLSAYDGEGLHVAFRYRHVSLTSYSMYLDDVVLGVATGCPHPVAVELGEATESTLTVSINDTAATGSYRLWVSHDSITDSIDIFDSAYTLYSLESGTRYTVSVASICAYGMVTESVSASAWTLCTIRDASELPFIESFEAWEANIHADLGACWQAHYGTADSAMGTYAKVYATGDLDNGGRHAVRLTAQHNYSTGEQFSTLVLPQFDVNPRMLQLDVKLRFGFQYTHEGEYVEAGIMADPADPQTFTPCVIIENPGNYQYHEYMARFGHFQGDAGAVAIRYHYNVPNDNSYIMVDSVSLTLLDEEDVACDVSTLSLADTTDSSATIIWDYNCEVDSFEVRLQSEVLERIIFTNQMQLTLTSLEPATQYSVRVRHVGQFWSSELLFTTADTLHAELPTDTTTTDTTDTDTTGIALSTMAGLSVAPNPVAAGEVVTVSGMLEGSVLTVTDATGRMVLRQRESAIGTARLGKGIYFVSISSDGQTAVRKLVVN